MNCTALESVTLAGELDCVFASAFEGCTSLTDIYYNGYQAWFTQGIVGQLQVPNTVTVHCTDGDFTIEPIA